MGLHARKGDKIKKCTEWTKNFKTRKDKFTEYACKLQMEAHLSWAREVPMFCNGTLCSAVKSFHLDAKTLTFSPKPEETLVYS